MQKIGIIGAGNMGSGIVQKTAQEGLSVVMVDPGRGLRRIYLKNNLATKTPRHEVEL